MGTLPPKLKWITGFLGVLMFASQVGPEEAVSNLSKWLAWLPISNALAAPIVDKWAIRIGIFLIVLTFILFIREYLQKHKHRIQTREKRMVTYFFIAFGVGAIVFVALAWVDPLKEEISWTNHDRALRAVFSKLDGTVFADYFMLRGTNNLDKPLKVEAAYLRSENTGEQFSDGRIEGVPADGATITPRFTFDVLIPFKNMPLPAFRQKLSDFVFVFKVDQRKESYEIRFDRTVTEKFIADAQLRILPTPEKPGVLPAERARIDAAFFAFFESIRTKTKPVMNMALPKVRYWRRWIETYGNEKAIAELREVAKSIDEAEKDLFRLLREHDYVRAEWDSIIHNDFRVWAPLMPAINNLIAALERPQLHAHLTPTDMEKRWDNLEAAINGVTIWAEETSETLKRRKGDI